MRAYERHVIKDKSQIVQVPFVPDEKLAGVSLFPQGHLVQQRPLAVVQVIIFASLVT